MNYSQEQDLQASLNQELDKTEIYKTSDDSIKLEVKAWSGKKVHK